MFVNSVLFSWPMDSVYLTDDLVARVNKSPPYNILSITEQEWHTRTQTEYVIFYKVLQISQCVIYI